MNKGTFFSGQPIFAQIVNLIPRGQVQLLAREFGTDRYYKKFKTYHHLITMLYTVYNRCTSLREVVTGLMACENRLRHVQVMYTPRRSTLADANCRRDYRVFEGIYRYLYRTYASVLPDSHPDQWMSKLYIVDSTTITLFSEVMKGVGLPAFNGKRKGGVKAHTLMKADEDVPRLVVLKPATSSDCAFLKEIDLPPGSIVVFDRAYVNYKIYNDWSEQKTTFITRVLKSAVPQPFEEREVPPQEQDCGIRRDTFVILGHKTQEHKVKARLIFYWDEKSQRSFEFLTNNFEMAPSHIARIYRQRWQIELLFKRIKQNYPLQYFLGDNPNAIKVQIWCALIADLLLKIIRKRCTRAWSFANLASMVRLHLMTYIDLISFLNQPEKALFQTQGKRRDDLEWSLFPT